MTDHLPCGRSRPGPAKARPPTRTAATKCAVCVCLAMGLLACLPGRGFADFQVSLDNNWNAGQPPGQINGTPPLLTFQDVQGGVLLTIQNSLIENSSPSVIDKVWLNFGQAPLSAGLTDNLAHLQFTAQSGTLSNLLTGFSTGENSVKADGTGGKYDILLQFANGNFAGGGTVAQYLITTTSSYGQVFNADTFDNLSSGATSPTPNLTASAHIIGGNNSSIYIGGLGQPVTPTPAPSGLALAFSGAAAVGLIALVRLRRQRTAPSRPNV